MLLDDPPQTIIEGQAFDFITRTIRVTVGIGIDVRTCLAGNEKWFVIRWVQMNS